MQKYLIPMTKIFLLKLTNSEKIQLILLYLEYTLSDRFIRHIIPINL